MRPSPSQALSSKNHLLSSVHRPEAEKKTFGRLSFFRILAYNLELTTENFSRREELRVICGTRGIPGTVAPFRAWRGSRDLVAQSPKFHAPADALISRVRVEKSSIAMRGQPERSGSRWPLCENCFVASQRRHKHECAAQESSSRSAQCFRLNYLLGKFGSAFTSLICLVCRSLCAAISNTNS